LDSRQLGMWPGMIMKKWKLVGMEFWMGSIVGEMVGERVDVGALEKK